MLRATAILQRLQQVLGKIIFGNVVDDVVRVDASEVEKMTEWVKNT